MYTFESRWTNFQMFCSSTNIMLEKPSMLLAEAAVQASAKLLKCWKVSELHSIQTNESAKNEIRGSGDILARHVRWYRKRLMPVNIGSFWGSRQFQSWQNPVYCVLLCDSINIQHEAIFKIPYGHVLWFRPSGWQIHLSQPMRHPCHYSPANKSFSLLEWIIT